MNYQESISRLEEASVFGIKPGLERMQKILAVLGNPEKACKMIHITGTNGKGSVAAMITSVLENTNLKVGRFTSPHLIDYTERIYLGGKDISREDFAKAATVVFKAHDELVAAGEEALTEFELLTAIAFWYFRENKADYAVMEVGMGGRFDATNVVMPVVSVITNVAMDHMQYLGNTLQEIARNRHKKQMGAGPGRSGETERHAERTGKEHALCSLYRCPSGSQCGGGSDGTYHSHERRRSD